MSERRDSALRRLEQALGYVFRDHSLIERALNHRSAAGRSNERLEFLGDAVLDTVVSAQLIAKFPDADEGVLSRLRASLVRDKSLGALASDLCIGELIRLGSGELKSGGSRRNSILADALEALFGAVFLDGHYVAAEAVILHVFESRLAELRLDAARKDAKTRLQEWLQSHGSALPAYRLLDTRGEPHKQTFYVGCEVDEQQATRGEGSSRRMAEQRAAAAMLEQLTGETAE
ncbi:MAG: ribonuclease III [Pseudomonadota bacterium]